MTELSRNIKFDSWLNKYTFDVLFDGENETLVFDTREAAYKEYFWLRSQGAHIMPLELDKSL